MIFLAAIETEGEKNSSRGQRQLKNSSLGQSSLLEEVLNLFVSGVAFAQPHFNGNPIDIADNTVML